MPAAPRLRLAHIVVRLRVSVDREAWSDTHGISADEVPDAVRRYVVELVRDSEAAQGRLIAGARRDGV